MSMKQCNYYGQSVGEFLVPVRVVYHNATDVIFSYGSPTKESVEKSVRQNFDMQTLDRIKKLAKEAYRLNCQGVDTSQEVSNYLEKILYLLGEK